MDYKTTSQQLEKCSSLEDYQSFFSSIYRQETTRTNALESKNFTSTLVTHFEKLFTNKSQLANDDPTERNKIILEFMKQMPNHLTRSRGNIYKYLKEDDENFDPEIWANLVFTVGDSKRQEEYLKMYSHVWQVITDLSQQIFEKNDILMKLTDNCCQTVNLQKAVECLINLITLKPNNVKLNLPHILSYITFHGLNNDAIADIKLKNPLINQSNRTKILLQVIQVSGRFELSKFRRELIEYAIKNEIYEIMSVLVSKFGVLAASEMFEVKKELELEKLENQKVTINRSKIELTPSKSESDLIKMYRKNINFLVDLIMFGLIPAREMIQFQHHFFNKLLDNPGRSISIYDLEILEALVLQSDQKYKPLHLAQNILAKSSRGNSEVSKKAQKILIMVGNILQPVVRKYEIEEKIVEEVISDQSGNAMSVEENSEMNKNNNNTSEKAQNSNSTLEALRKEVLQKSKSIDIKRKLVPEEKSNDSVETKINSEPAKRAKIVEDKKLIIKEEEKVDFKNEAVGDMLDDLIF